MAVVAGQLEIADDMLRRAKLRFARHFRSGRLRLHRGSLTELPLDDTTCDAVITVNTVNTVYFVADIRAACAELARVLRPGGRVVVGIGNPDVMRQAPFTRYGFMLRPVDEIAVALSDSGLAVEHRSVPDKPIPRRDRREAPGLSAQRSLSKHFSSTRLLMRQPSAVRTNSSTYQIPTK